jgi:hypothetical protein
MKQEIKSKLREIGYTGKTDLETILEALPTSVEGMVFGLEKTMIGYGNTKTFKIYEEAGNESLADTAARLLIALAEQKIINFK